MATVVRRNERSWAIDLISKINLIAKNNDLVIKKAGGENTISTGRGNTMFPDVVLYGNVEQSVILQGWELKMPDVPIEDETFIKDAQRKAIALNLNSCLIWNFTYAVLYVREEGNSFKKIKQWNATNHIHTREDVETYRSDWEKQLEEIITEVNGYFVSGQFRNAPLGQIISESTIPNINGEILKVEYLKPESSLASSTLSTKIVYMWGWSDGLIRVDSSPDAGVAFNSASSIALAYFGKQLGTLRSIVLTCFQLTASDFISLYGETRLVRGETYENCYYQNKIACAYVNGNWLPGCEIGSRRLFHGSLAGYKTNAGQWIMDKWTQPQVGRPENNPTNYNDIQKKNHFDDNQWMMNRAIEYYTTFDAEKYIDIFANVYNTL